jgi:hypothetical protein
LQKLGRHEDALTAYEEAARLYLKNRSGFFADINQSRQYLASIGPSRRGNFVLQRGVAARPRPSAEARHSIFVASELLQHRALVEQIRAIAGPYRLDMIASHAFRMRVPNQFGDDSGVNPLSSSRTKPCHEMGGTNRHPKVSEPAFAGKATNSSTFNAPFRSLASRRSRQSTAFG